MWGHEDWIFAHASRVTGLPHVLVTEEMTKLGGKYPLLIKRLKVNKALSLQVHPGSDSPGHKSEAWVITKTGPSAKIWCGLNTGVDRATFRDACTWCNDPERLLRSYIPEVGQVYWIPGGVPHACQDIEFLEVQTASDVTYRLYDWGRTGDRELSLNKGLDAIKWSDMFRNYYPVGALPYTTPYFKLVYTLFAVGMGAHEVKGVRLTNTGPRCWVIMAGSATVCNPSGDPLCTLNAGDTWSLCSHDMGCQMYPDPFTGVGVLSVYPGSKLS